MHDKSSRSMPVFIGFFLVLLMLCVVAGTAFYSVKTITVMTDHLAENAEANNRIGRALREFDAARLAAARFRETNDPKFEKLIIERIQEACKNFDETRQRFYSPEIQKFADEIAVRCNEFAKICGDDVRLGEEIERNRSEGNAIKVKVFEILNEFETAQKQIDDDAAKKAENGMSAEFRKVQDGLARFFELYRDLSNERLDAVTEAAVKQRNEIAASLRTLVEKAVTQKGKQLLLEATDHFERANVMFQECAGRQSHRLELRQTQEKIAAETEKLGDELTESQLELSERFHHETEVVVRQTSLVLVGVSAFAVIFCIAIGFAVARRVNRNAPAEESGGFANPLPSNDLRVVADKLQEVVELLRR